MYACIHFADEKIQKAHFFAVWKKYLYTYTDICIYKRKEITHMCICICLYRRCSYVRGWFQTYPSSYMYKYTFLMWGIPIIHMCVCVRAYIAGIYILCIVNIHTLARIYKKKYSYLSISIPHTDALIKMFE